MFCIQTLDESDVQEAQQKVVVAVVLVLKKGRFKGRQICMLISRGRCKELAQCKFQKLHPLEKMSLQILICILLFASVCHQFKFVCQIFRLIIAFN